MDVFNIYLAGVGGQGIGLLSEVVLRAADHAGLPVRGVDTHGLAQRGGIVVSRVRIGAGAHAPLMAAGTADLVVALERCEAYRALQAALRDGGTLIYYDTDWQPLAVRLGDAEPVTAAMIAAICRARRVRRVRVWQADLADARMQNVAVLGHMDRLNLVPGVAAAHYRQAMADLLDGAALKANLALFDEIRTRPSEDRPAPGRPAQDKHAENFA